MTTVIKLNDKNVDLFMLIATLSKNSANISIGANLKILRNETGLSPEKIMEYLYELQTDDFLTQEIVQIGTAGPYDTYFKLIKGFTFEATLTRPERISKS